MTITVYPVDAVSGAPQFSAQQARQAMSYLVGGATSTRPLGGLTGIRPGTGVCVTATSSTWTITPHAGCMDLEAATNAGPYGYAIDANVTGTVTAADGTNPRIDIVYLTLADPAEGDGSSTPSVTAGYQAGTPAASPVAPTVPSAVASRSMILAQISVPKVGAGSPSVTMVAPYTAAAGGVVLCTSSTRPANPYAGMPIFESDTKALRVWDGSTWITVKVAKVRAGTTASDGAVTNTGWTVHPNSPTTTVKAPPSGSLLVHFGGSVFIGGSASTYGTGLLAVQANGAGLSNVISADTASHAALGQSSANVANTTIITGLTADQNVTLTLVDQVGTGNAIYFNTRWMLVEQM